MTGLKFRRFISERRDSRDLASLQKAVEQDRLDIVRHLLASPERRQRLLSSIGATGKTTLEYAVERRGLNVVRYLAQSIDMEQLKYGKSTVVAHAIGKAGFDLLKAILESAPKAAAFRDSAHGWPLHQLVRLGHRDAVALLLGKEADPKALDEANRTPLGAAIEMRKYDVAEMIIKYTPGFEGTDEQVIHHADLHIPTLRFLIRHGADINAFRNGTTISKESVRKGSLETVEFLLESGAHMRVDKDSLLFFALSNQPIFELLLSHGANIREFHHGKSLLDLAIDSEDTDAIIRLLERDVPLSGDLDVDKLLHMAIESPISVKRLLDAGANALSTADNVNVGKGSFILARSRR
ncbi:MAG: hypothetical protein LQ342_005682 [Letrouitia transgressa]|nr:MAG: hypothetical protein LQ342_005682 [Letrouitia transgressa]